MTDMDSDGRTSIYTVIESNISWQTTVTNTANARFRMPDSDVSSKASQTCICCNTCTQEVALVLSMAAS